MKERKEAPRDRFGKVLVDLAKQDKNVLAMDCDLGRSTRAYKISEVDKERFLEMGIAEQNMISTAAGLAHEGKIVFINSFAVFLTGRGFDQIRQQIALPKMNVKICGSSAGLTQGCDGATHQSIVDVALMRSLPNMTVLAPADGPQTEAAVRYAYSLKGPVYLRLSRYEIENIFSDQRQEKILEVMEIKNGKNVALVSCGPILMHVLKAADLLDKEGISTGVINIPVIKPLDSRVLISLARKYKALFVVEEHNKYGGLSSAVAEVVAGMKDVSKAWVKSLGLQDVFGQSGKADELLAEYGLNAEGIVKQVKKAFVEE
ncbi:MAG: transketolase family protein [Spirochaetales bacterium]|nr:transketolase family protein [Spirochaetales bacterium]